MLKSAVFATAFIVVTGIAIYDGALAQTVGGGGSTATDCWVTFNSNPAPNSPASKPKYVKCPDQDATCGDADARLGYCEFQLQVNLNSTGFASCAPTDLPSQGFHIPFSGPTNDDHPKNIADFEVFQTFADDSLPLHPATPTDPTSTDIASNFKPVTVPLKISLASNGPVFVTNTVTMSPTMCKAALTASNKFKCPVSVQKDADTFKLTCTPPVDGTGAKISACTGITSTFQQIQEHIFDRKCSSQASCHGSPVAPHDLCLKPACGSRSAYGDLVCADAGCTDTTGAAPTNFFANDDGLKRVAPFDLTKSLLIHKILGGKQLDSAVHGTGVYGLRMPYNNPAADRKRAKLTKGEIRLISDWVLAGAPATGFVSSFKGACH